jgi:hypothetical protein
MSRNKALLIGIIIAMGAYMTSQTLPFALGPPLGGFIGFVGPVPWSFAVVHGGASSVVSILVFKT